MDDRNARLRRVCFSLALIAAVWAALAAATGGISATAGPIRISSRNPRNPAILALAALIGSYLLAPRDGRMATLLEDLRWAFSPLRRLWRTWCRVEDQVLFSAPAALASAAALAVALLIVIIGLTEGVPVAAASDSSGYVSQAHQWATGTLRIEQPLMREIETDVPLQAFAPLAYVPAPDGSAIVPVTAPGLPMMMAVFEMVGGPDAVYVVVPLLAGIAVGATYMLGRIVAGPWAGLIAATLFAASPAFLFQLTSAPMSDVPAAALWTLALAFALQPGHRSAAAAGIAAGAAILTRPNLVPLALVPGLVLLAPVARRRSLGGADTKRAWLFAAGSAPACACIAVLYDYWYGSPFTSGYGSFSGLYRWEHAAANFARYPRWLLESQSPIVLLALAAPLLARIRITALVLLAFVAAVYACYAFYLPFDAWWFLRFLLPAFPALLVLASSVLVLRSMRLPRGLRVIVAAAAVAAATYHGVQYARANTAFNMDGERKYEVAGRYVATRLPERAVLIAMQHSGSARYYSERTTLFYPWIPRTALDPLVRELQAKGYEPYLLLEDWEEADFRSQFAGQRTIAALDRMPLADLAPGSVRIYKVDALN